MYFPADSGTLQWNQSNGFVSDVIGWKAGWLRSQGACRQTPDPMKVIEWLCNAENRASLFPRGTHQRKLCSCYHSGSLSCTQPAIPLLYTASHPTAAHSQPSNCCTHPVPLTSPPLTPNPQPATSKCDTSIREPIFLPSMERVGERGYQVKKQTLSLFLPRIPTQPVG